MEIVDRTGQPVTLEELNDAIHTVEQILLKKPTVLPEFMVNGMAVRRALLELRESRLKETPEARGGPMAEFSSSQRGILSIENLPDEFGLNFGPNGRTFMECGVEAMVSIDGRIWVNVNGICFIRFKPTEEAKHE